MHHHGYGMTTQREPYIRIEMRPDTARVAESAMRETALRTVYAAGTHIYDACAAAVVVDGAACRLDEERASPEAITILRVLYAEWRDRRAASDAILRALGPHKTRRAERSWTTFVWLAIQIAADHARTRSKDDPERDAELEALRSLRTRAFNDI